MHRATRDTIVVTKRFSFILFQECRREIPCTLRSILYLLIWSRSQCYSATMASRMIDTNEWLQRVAWSNCEKNKKINEILGSLNGWMVGLLGANRFHLLAFEHSHTFRTQTWKTLLAYAGRQRNIHASCHRVDTPDGMKAQHRRFSHLRPAMTTTPHRYL